MSGTTDQESVVGLYFSTEAILAIPLKPNEMMFELKDI